MLFYWTLCWFTSWSKLIFYTICCMYLTGTYIQNCCVWRNSRLIHSITWFWLLWQLTDGCITFRWWYAFLLHYLLSTPLHIDCVTCVCLCVCRPQGARIMSKPTAEQLSSTTVSEASTAITSSTVDTTSAPKVSVWVIICVLCIGLLHQSALTACLILTWFSHLSIKQVNHFIDADYCFLRLWSLSPIMSW